jgi:hypothetical protein
MGAARRLGGTTASQTRRSTWHLNLSITSTDRRVQKHIHDSQRMQPLSEMQGAQRPRCDLGVNRAGSAVERVGSETGLSRVKNEEPEDSEAGSEP